MDIGVSVPLPTCRVDVGVMARIAEEFGFESIWCADHPIMPVATTSRFPGTADRTVPDSYAHVVDPFVALARASGMTTRIRLGTGITLVPERNPLAPGERGLDPRPVQWRPFSLRHRHGVAPRGEHHHGR